MQEKVNYKPKILMHYVMPGSTGGPNILFNRIEESKLLKNKYDFVELNQKRVAGGKLNVSLILELREEISKVKPDLIHISGMQSAGFHCMIAAVLAGCKNRLITTHGFSGDALGIGKFKRVAFEKILEPITLIFARHVHCISKFTYNRKMVRKFADKKRTCIYNYHSNEYCDKDISEIRESLSIRNNEIVFTAVSRIVFDKGYKQLAQAIKMTSSLVNIKYIIVGDGDYEDTLEDMLRDEINNNKVIMLGRRNDVNEILKASDVFILPTLHENLGNVFLEASSVGIPSIGTNVGGVPEVIEDGITGILVEPNNSKDLVDAIKKLYDDKILRMRMGKNALLKINKTFSVKDIEKKFDELYNFMIY